MHLRNAERELLRFLSKAVMQGRTDYERSAFLRSSSSKRAELERLTKAEGLPKNISIEELTFPSVVELNLQHKSMEFII